MKKKSLLLLSLIFLMPIIANAQDSTNITDVLEDSFYKANDATTEFGTLAILEVREKTVNMWRALVKWNITDQLPVDVEVMNATACLYLNTNGDSDNITAYHVLDHGWSGENETTINWNNQVCGTGFNNAAECNLEPLDSINVTTTGYNCWNITDAYFNEIGQNITIAFKTPELLNLASEDEFSSREGANTPYLEVYHTELTNLTLIHETVLNLGENNLIQGNYSYLESGLAVINATCNLTFDSDSVLMPFNNSTQFYEGYIIPDEIGIFDFTVNCTAEQHVTQIQNASTLSYFLSAEPYNITVGLFENLNGTVPYKDEFSSIMVEGLDYNCTLITGFEACWRVEEYNDGVAYFNETSAVGNLSFWYYSGSVTQNCDLCPPNLETFNTAKLLGTFIFDQNRTELFLYVDVQELDFWKAASRGFWTYGILIIGIIVAIVVAILVAVGLFMTTKNTTASFMAGLLAFVILIYILMFFNVIPDISGFGISDII